MSLAQLLRGLSVAGDDTDVIDALRESAGNRAVDCGRAAGHDYGAKLFHWGFGEFPGGLLM
ncbi:MAG: hypothetical protein ACYDAE_10750 [Steroidobacteraceae bacterium]